MSLGDFAGGFTKSISNYLTGERERTRKAEDDEIEYQRSMIQSLISRPDFNPAHLGKAMHDLIEMGQGKAGKRKQKPGADGFLGHTELPLSQFFSGVMSGATPIMDPPTPDPPKPVAWSMPQGPAKAELLGPNPMTGEQVLNEPVMVPPKGTFVPSTAEGLASAGQQMQVSAPPLLMSPEQMGKQRGRANAASDREQILGKLGTISEFVTDPEDQQAAQNAALGVPATQFLGTSTKTFVTEDGREFPGTPLKTGGIFNHNTGAAEVGTNPIPKEGVGQKLSSLYQLAAVSLGLLPDSATWNPQQAALVQQWLMSNEGQRTAMNAGLRGQVQLAVGWHLPKIIQGTDPATGQAITAITSGAAQGGGPRMPQVAIPPMPQPAGPSNMTPPQPAIAPPPVNPNGNRPNMSSAVTATPNPQRPVVNNPVQPPQAQPTSRGGLATAPGGGIIAPPPADLRIQSAGLQAIPSILKEVDLAITPLNAGNLGNTAQGGSATEGVMNRAKGLIRTGMGMAGGDDAAASYTSAKKSFVASLSRFAGEKGVLTDADVSRAANMLPNIGDSKDLTKWKLDRVQRFLEARMQGLPDPYVKEGSPDQAQPSVLPTPPDAQGWAQTPGGVRYRVKPNQ